MRKKEMSGNKNDLSSFYLRLMMHPRLNGKTNAEISRELGVSPNTVGLWKRLGVWPDISTLERVADALDVEMAWFFMNQFSPRDLDVDNGLGEMAVQRLEKSRGEGVRFVVAGDGDSVVIDLRKIVLLVQSHLSPDELWYFLFGEEYHGHEPGVSGLQDG